MTITPEEMDRLELLCGSSSDHILARETLKLTAWVRESCMQCGSPIPFMRMPCPCMEDEDKPCECGQTDCEYCNWR